MEKPTKKAKVFFELERACLGNPDSRYKMEKYNEFGVFIKYEMNGIRGQYYDKRWWDVKWDYACEHTERLTIN